jgi:hypothetical protein
MNPLQLLAEGIYAQHTVTYQNLFELVKLLYPVRTQYRLIRVGAALDGGYLVPDDLSNISTCFSPGVAETASFEQDLLSTYGIGSHLADYSVEGPPSNFIPKSFIKKFVGPVDDNKHITIENWISIVEPYNEASDYILQMDIEGDEYATLLSCPIDILCRFRIIILEMHNLYAWGEQNVYVNVNHLLNRILSYYYVVHSHPNNNDGLVSINGLLSPRTLEITLLRKDRAHKLGYQRSFPHVFDRPNVTFRDDLTLPSNFFLSNSKEEPTSVILCRPQGGLNDILCSVARCWAYAKRTGRSLAIDTRASGLMDDFWKYFEATHEWNVKVHELEYDLFESLDSVPTEVAGKLNMIKAEYSLAAGGFVDKNSGALLTFDVSRSYDTPLLLHEQGWYGGQFESPNILKVLQFTNIVARDIRLNLATLPRSFVGIHIRHTDYTTDYVPFLESLRSSVSGKDILICTDNLTVFDYCLFAFPNCNVFRLSKFTDNNNSRRHYRDFGIDQYKNNIETLVDLCALGLSKSLYFHNVREAGRPSGFSLLANFLNQNSDVLMRLLRVPENVRIYG